ncbi:glucosidase 2 subunit beta-like isoform X5 [Perca fluviatilis]|uniref:glucosidase 2 subunit beta-like isoform X5 n=1 Tax=Perca fluviatilis TaxID=8168 RepID=UPI001962BE4B|nr:glucosidase 2 subunit beta-like isoform X5 [Perca fluviatilis]
MSSDMHFHIIIAAVFWCGFVDSRKIRGISSSCPYLQHRQHVASSYQVAIAADDKRFYRERKSFLCIDGSKIIPFEQVNDDYCDCEDGSDEPGTSACPRGRFYCTNLGFRPHYIPSSRVNDGICDCCDASDEYNSHAHCQNTCWNLGQRERAYVEGQMRTLDEGLQLKQQLIEEGVLLWREKQAQLRELQQVAEDLQIKLEEHRRKKHEADRLKEQTIKALEAGGSSLRRQNRTVSSTFKLLDSNKDGSITVDEVQAKVALVHDEEQVLSEDEAVALLGGGHQMDLTKFQYTLWDILTKGDHVKIKDTRGAPGSLVGEDPHLKAADTDIMTRLLKIIHRPGCGQINLGNYFLSTELHPPNVPRCRRKHTYGLAATPLWLSCNVAY